MATDTTPSAHNYTDSQVVAIARHVTWVGFGVNALLSALKIGTGIIGRSSAMVADGVHSLSDFITDLIVIVMIGISRRQANTSYQYGYGKYETMATLIIGVALGAVAIALFFNGLNDVIGISEGHTPERPGMIALWMAVISIIAKEILFRYTRRCGEQIGSAAVIANAWHHRSDAFSSIATLVGVGGAILLGPSWRILDPLAAMVVSAFIGMASVNIAHPAVRELLEVSLPEQLTARIRRTIASAPGVITYHHLRTRSNGPRVIIDVHLKVDPKITVEAGHAIASEVESRLRAEMGQAMILNIHVEPYRGQNVMPDGSCAD